MASPRFVVRSHVSVPEGEGDGPWTDGPHPNGHSTGCAAVPWYGRRALVRDLDDHGGQGMTSEGAWKSRGSVAITVQPFVVWATNTHVLNSLNVRPIR